MHTHLTQIFFANTHQIHRSKICIQSKLHKYSLFNLWSTLHKLVTPELERGILDELNESDEQSPRMRAVHYQSLQQDSSDLLLDGLCIGLRKEVKEGAAEVVSVTVGVAQLIGDCIEEQIAACSEGRKVRHNEVNQ